MNKQELEQKKIENLKNKKFLNKDELKILIKDAEKNYYGCKNDFDKLFALYKMQNYVERLERLKEHKRFSEQEVSKKVVDKEK